MEQSKIPEKLYALETSMQSFAHVAYQISYALKIISVNIGTVSSQLERARDALIEGNCDIEKYLDNAQDFLNKTSQSTNEIMCRLMKVRGENNMLFKAIEHGKEKRRPWRHGKAVDRTCCNHGSCPWCRDNRRHRFIVAEKLKGDSNEDDGVIEQ